MKLLGTAYKLSKDQLSKDPPVLTMEASATSTICNSESRVVDGLHSVGDDLDNVARKLNFFSLVES